MTHSLFSLRGKERGRARLLKPHARLLVQDQLIEDGEHLLAVLINALQRIPEAQLVAARVAPLHQQRLRHVDIASQRVGGVAAQKEPVEHGRLSLRGQWIYVFPGCHANYLSSKKASINTGAI